MTELTESSEQELENESAPEILNEEQQLDLQSRSEPFVGKWNKLVSTTNWEKGAIVNSWRKAMEKSDLPKSSFSDERWSQLCGGATPQHVGRLRRTWGRFGHVYKQYEGLFWSHFFVALEWEDAEMWLEGAIQNSWSVSKMRNARWETMGQRPEDKPRIDQIVISELDEESQSIGTAARANERGGDYSEGPIPEGPDFGDSEDGQKFESKRNDGESENVVNESVGPKIRPFESFSNLPDDISSAANSFKIAIIKHKANEWQDISVEDLNGLLDALKSLATAASE